MNAKKSIPAGERLRTNLCAFLLPCILLATVLAATGIFPFGDKSLLIIDMNNEYVDYLAQMNESLRTGDSLVRSWNMGMGLNMLGLVAFYTSSPFNILVLLFPVEVITEVLFVITLLKVGLAGLLFALFTGYAIDRRGLFAVIFSVAYALCGYNIAYASNIMWLDGVAFLPLVLLGVEKLLREKKWGILLFGLAYAFFSSYYIGYMIGVFATLYLTAVHFSRSNSLREFFQGLGRLVVCALTAAGCCAFLLLPAFLNLRSGQVAMWGSTPPLTLDRSFVRIASRMLPGVYDTLTDAGYPNIYCTMLGLVLMVAYFLHREIPRRQKAVFGGLLGFFLLSFSCRFLYLSLHAFEDPTWFPARYSFLFSFLVLYLAMEAAKRLGAMTLAGVTGTALILVALIAEIGVQRLPNVPVRSLAAGLGLLALYGLLWLAGRKDSQRWLGATALVLVCCEVWVNAYTMEQGLDKQFRYTSRESYTSYRARYLPAVEAVESTNPYRLEIVEQRNANGGMALGYNGISHYSTTTDQNLNGLLRLLGYNKGTMNELRFTPSTPLTGGLLGVRYVLTTGELGGGYARTDTVGEVGIYGNTCAFPMAYWTGGAALDWTSESQDPFALQNEMVRALTGGGDVFAPLTGVEQILHNVDLEQKEGYLQYTPRVKSEPSSLEFRLSNPGGRECYAFLPVWNNKFAAADVFVDGREAGRDLRYRGNTVISLGSGEEITLTLELGAGITRIREQYFYALDLPLAQELAAKAGENAMNFTRFSDTAVDGSVLAERDGALITSFPFDTGWRVWVDGKRVEPQRFAGVFLALPISGGEHVVTMRYSPPGFRTGCAISALTAAGLLVFWLRARAKPDFS